MVLDRMRTELYETTINTWFDEVTPVAVEGDTLILHCPNDFKRSTIEDRFLGNIAGSMKDIFSADFTIRVLSDAQLQAFLLDKDVDAFLANWDNLWQRYNKTVIRKYAEYMANQG